MSVPAIDGFVPVAYRSPDVGGLQASFAGASSRIAELQNAITGLTADLASIQQLIAQLQAEMAALEAPDPSKYRKTETRMEGNPPVPVKVQVFDTAAFNAAMAKYEQKLQSLESRITEQESKLASKENELARKQSDLAKAQEDLAAAQKKLEQALANDQKKLAEQRKTFEEQNKKAEEAQKKALEAQAQAQKAQDDLARAQEALEKMSKSVTDLGAKRDDVSLKAFKDDSDKAKNDGTTALASAKNHLPRTENGNLVKAVSALSSTDFVEVIPRLSAMADGLSGVESGLLLGMVYESPGIASRESLDAMESYWRGAGFSEKDIATAMMTAGGGDKANVDAAMKRIRELLDESGAFNDVTHDELNQIGDVINGLNRVETRAVISQLSDDELKHWGNEINSGGWFGTGGLSGDEKKNLLGTLADRLDSGRLVEFADKALRNRTDTLELATAVAEKSGDFTKDAFVDAMTTPTSGLVSKEDYELLAAMDPRLEIPQITGDNQKDAAAIADSLQKLSDDPQLQEQFLNYFMNFDGVSDPILRSTLELDDSDKQLFADVLSRTYDRDPSGVSDAINRISDSDSGLPMGLTGDFSGGFSTIISLSGNTSLINAYAAHELDAAAASVDDSGRALDAATALAGLPATGPGSLQEFLRNNTSRVDFMMDQIGGRLGGPALNAGFPNPFIASPVLGNLLERMAQMTDASGKLAPEALDFFESALPALGDNYFSLQGAAAFVLNHGDQIDAGVQRDFLTRILCSPIGAEVETGGMPALDLLVNDPKFAPMFGIASADRKGVIDAYRSLIEDDSFRGLDADGKLAIASQALNYPNADAINNLRNLSGADWFRGMSTEDKQRSARMVGYVTTRAELSSNAEQKQILLTSIGQFLPPDGTLKLDWKPYSDPPGQITSGSAADGTLSLNEAMIPVGNEPIVFDDTAIGLAMSTMPHEVNHLMTGHTDAGTYDRFIDEYRAWYVGYLAENGSEPSRADAWSRIHDELTLPAYSHLADAAKEIDRSVWDHITGDPGEPSDDSKKIVEFAAKFYDPSAAPDPNDRGSGQTVINDTANAPFDPSALAPLPDPNGNLDNSGKPG